MALSRHHAAFSRPISVEDIVKEASNFDFTPNRPMQQWLRAAKMLLTEAAICEQDDNYQTAYLYVYRHCELVLTKLATHPDYKDPRFKQDLAQARKAVQKNLVKLEQWKPRINQEHQLYVKAMERRNAERQRIQEEFDEMARHRQSYDYSRSGSRASADSVPDSPTQALNANENREFAVNLAQREIRRRDATRQSTRQAGISPATVASRRQGVVEGDYFGNDVNSISNGVREAGRYANTYAQKSEGGQNMASQALRATSYQYPMVPQRASHAELSAPTTQQNFSRPLTHLPPPLPAKESLHQSHSNELYAQPPALPPKQGYETPPTATTSTPPASVQLTSKYTFKPTAFTESGSPLRTVLLPPELRQTFLSLAHANTSRNLETCGILAATVISNALFINHLIIPDQTSTSDTCDTTSEGDNALFDYCDANELLVCGWIHTHPTQSCFLSSRDLHTSSGYQVMLPEAIAIVCAPRHNPDWGIFRLTDPPGLGHILDCTKPGIFHPHSETNLYTDALKPGHVVEGPGLRFEVVDLRK